MADDMGWGDPGFNGGSVPTPHLDRLASESIQLERFYTFPSCSPTRAALLSGVFPHRLGIPAPVRMIDPGLPEDTPLLPQLLQTLGYQTTMIGKWHLGGEYVPAQRPHQRGFDTFYGSYQTGLDYFTHKTSSGELDWWLNDQVMAEEGYITHLQADFAERLILASNNEQPFFLFFAPHAPHSPFQAPPETVAKFSHLSGRAGPEYAAMISEFDFAVGRILHAIDESGQRENTIVIFFSDNGGTRVSNRGEFNGQKNSLFEGGIRSPFLLRWPGRLNSNHRADFVSSVMDVAPTLLSAAGIDPRTLTPTDGINLLPYLSDRSKPQRQRIVIGHHDFAAITSEWKLIRTTSGAQLYHLTKDPNETTDLAATEPKITQKLTQFLASFTAQLPDSEPRPNRRRGRQSN